MNSFARTVPADLADAALPVHRCARDFCTPDGQAVVLADLEAVWHAANAQVHLLHDWRLGEVLVANGSLSPESLQQALTRQRSQQPHQPLGQLLQDAGLVTPAELSMALAATMSMPVVDTAALEPEPEALAALPEAFARRQRALPLLRRPGTLVVAVDDPWARPLLDEMRFLTNLRILPVMALPQTLDRAVAQAYDRRRQAQIKQEHAIEELAAELSAQAAASAPLPAEDEVITESSSALVRLVHTMIEDAVQRHASDIHIEATGPATPVVIRFRVDGTLVPYLEMPARWRPAIVARLKIMSDLDIAEHRKPQDGKIDFSRFSTTAMELRVVIVPTSHGVEDVVLRLLSGAKPMPLDDIGLNADNLGRLRQVIAKPYGLVVVCGPTGCGKTTSLHSILRELNNGERKIWTAEDPIEITQPGLCQVQVNPRIGWTFAAAMRTFLRADPDVIMIGEMRDEETARIAIEASLTGHLVFSTLHTNSAAESIARLLEIGLDPFNFSDSLLGVLAQRLVRRLCTQCRRAEVAGDDEIEAMAHAWLRSSHEDDDPARRDALLTRWRHSYGDVQGRLRLWRRSGCPACNGHGYKGRMGIHELLVADDTIRHHIRHRASAADILHSALAQHMLTMRQDGIEKVLQGLTDMAEVLAANNN